MTTARETWVLCDDATRPSAPADALHLTLGEKGQSITVNIGGIDGALTGRLAPRFHDLIRIAAFVLAADGAVGRGKANDDDKGEKWHRTFHLVAGVDDPGFWNQAEVIGAIEGTLGFLSQDNFHFEFQPRGKKPNRQLVFSGPQGEPVVPWHDVEEVSLFSGGLDSFAGAADLILGQKRSTVLVSHRSATKVTAVQNGLFDDLRRIAEEHGCPPPEHVAVTLARHESRLRGEHTQRTRSFLYAAIAGAVANLIGRNRVCMYENGIIAINLPIAGSVVGARATRTAHPRVLSGFAKILSQVAGRTFEVRNPFALRTRAEIIKGLASSPALPLAKRTVSCAHVHRQSKMHPHCGICSQCIDRQFGFLGAGMEEHDSGVGYDVQLAHGEWKDEGARALLLNWVGAADSYTGCENADGFLDAFGDAARAVPFIMESCGVDANAASQAVYDLHRRHGEAVRRVIEEVKLTGKKARSLTMNTLQALLLRKRPTKIPRGGGPERFPFGIENRLVFGAGSWRITFRNGPVLTLPDAKGLRYLSFLLRAPATVYLASTLIDLAEGREPSKNVVLDERGKYAVQDHIHSIEAERGRAQEMCDEQAAARCQTEIDALTDLMARKGDVVPGSGAIAEAVESDLRSAIAAIKEANPVLGHHLEDNLQLGAVLWYHRSAPNWDTAPAPAPDASASVWVPARTLVDAEVHVIRGPREVGRFCERFEVPTRRGKTKAGREHQRRLEVHAPTFRAALRRQQAEERLLQDAADRALTEREKRAGGK
ncbi:MAG TPA: hypothetical protein VFZ65_01510 [Planctomycetota bacterium]|nr:hypothetical protein [Planctomycetota bacterium]